MTTIAPTTPKSWKDRDEDLMPNWYVDYPKLEAENKALKTENARLKEALESIDDHGRALEAMEIMKGQNAEIEKLKKEIKRLNEIQIPGK